MEYLRRRDEVHSVHIRKIYYVYAIWQKAYAEVNDPSIIFTNSIAEVQSLVENEETDLSNCVIIFDDCLQLFKKQYNDFLINCFVNYSHHKNCGIILFVQNSFAKNMREISINATYLLLGSYPVDQSFITRLGTQLFPHKYAHLQYAYTHVMREPYKFLFIDLNPLTPVKCRVRSSIYPDEAIVYVPE